MRIIGKNIGLRLAEVSDAKFILDIRSDNKKTRYLSKVDNDIEKQKAWLVEYKKKELNREEYYFIICNKDNVPCGTVRAYDFKGNSFSWGSWLINSKLAPVTAGIESALLMYEFAFYYLCFENCHFEVVSENTKVRSFHEKMGALVSSANRTKTFYKYNKTTYEAIRSKYIRYIPERTIICE